MRDFENTGRIYEALQDETSRFIFMVRSMYCLTRDISFLQKMINQAVPDVQYLRQVAMAIPEGANDYIFGAGKYLQYYLRIFSRKWKGIVDNDKILWGGYRQGLLVISPDELSLDARVFIANRDHRNQIYSQLREMGFENNQIVTNLNDILCSMSQKQYFDLPALYHSKNEVFVDVGAYNGFSAKCFAKWSREDYRMIYSFEPNASNRALLNDNLKKWNILNVKIEPYGLWNETCQKYVFGNGGGSRTGDVGDTPVKMKRLDEQLYADEITFIKMDIEGSELRALQGCEKIIKRNHPKLAICIYHKPEDIFEIPELILSYYPGYKLFLRHYTIAENETVLYAV